MEYLMTIGVLLVVIGIVFIIASGINMVLSNSNRVEFAFGGFIGFIPFGFFTSKKMFWVWFGVLVVGMVLWLLGRRLV